ncbi:MAG: MarC family protein [Luteitalea sp.]|nr:MarC family protein [Luteitalea sp.]
MDSFARSVLLMFVLLNPFILSVYLMGLVRVLHFRDFARQLVRAALISLVVFVLFAWGGVAVFEDVMQVRYAAFLIFGGLIFLITAIRLIAGAGHPVAPPRPQEDVSAAIAMPYLVGPGTISAAVLAGSRLDSIRAPLAIALALGLAIVALLAFKLIHDYVRSRSEALVFRYTEITGRATALFVGSFAIDMILRGFETWLQTLPAVTRAALLAAVP